MHVRTGIVAAAGALVVVGGAWGQPAVDAEQLKYWRPSAREAYRQYEDALRSIPEASSLRRYHDLTASRPHGAGTPGDDQMIETLVREFEAMGLEVERHPFWAYLSWPIDAAVEIVAGDGVDGPIALPVKERPFEGDPYADHPELRIAFNAYSGSGDVTGEVVYANYGRLEDFEKLEELGVDLTGKVVIARYGGNYRGYKAKFAEEAGAAGLLIYTDPADNGYVKGLEYPEGGWAGPEHIQRGSIKTLPYAGDPLTPGVYASEDAERLDPDEVALARIPVQPIGYGAAQQILERMRGERVPERSWQGGLPLAYRVEGGEALRVRVMVEQERRITKLHNVIATLKGSEFPEQRIVLGSHHDSWGFGAGDSTSGLICLLETARAFAEMAERGQPPKRTLVFAGWGAEEHGIIGSTEWVEHHADDLSESAIAYINMDMSAMGPNFGSSAAPSLKRIIVESSKAVPQAREPGMSVYEHWHGRGRDADFPDEPRIGDLGGGSDHIAFWCHLAIPSLSLGGGGSDGVSYHGVADNLHWYRQVVGEDYEPALMVTRMAVTVASRLANAELLPLDPARDLAMFRRYLDSVASVAADNWERLPAEKRGLHPSERFAELDGKAKYLEFRMSNAMRRLYSRAADDDEFYRFLIDDLEFELPHLSGTWYRREVPGDMSSFVKDDRYWFRNALIAPDPDSGYAALSLPLLREYARNPVLAYDLWQPDKNPCFPSGATPWQYMAWVYFDAFSYYDYTAGLIDWAIEE